MGTGQRLGEFEQVVLLAAGRLGEDAYGMTIRRLLLERIGREVSIGAIYATVDRLVRKGYLNARLGEATATRGGKAKRFVSLTPAGIGALERSKKEQALMWTGLEFSSGTKR